jgi:hypothetical protein
VIIPLIVFGAAFGLIVLTLIVAKRDAHIYELITDAWAARAEGDDQRVHSLMAEVDRIEKMSLVAYCRSAYGLRD